MENKILKIFKKEDDVMRKGFSERKADVKMSHKNGE